jgi:hypothetical protein
MLVCSRFGAIQQYAEYRRLRSGHRHRYFPLYSVLIIAVILVKFCWGFSTESNKESEKKIKMRDSTKKKGGLVRGKQKVDLEREQEPPKTTERFVSPRKTTTNTTL